MTPFIRNILLTTSLTAVLLGAVQILAAMPDRLHRAGIAAPATWEQAVVDLLELK
jgi:hypothetical protein